MGWARGLRVAAAALAAGAVLGSTAQASGPGSLAPWYLDEFGGPPADLKALYSGRVGLVMARAPRPMLYIDWRLLHGRKVGAAIGAPLSIPCCALDAANDRDETPSPVEAWQAARMLAPGAPKLGGFMRLERKSGQYEYVQVCFSDALNTATATLKDRIARFGATSPFIAVWLATQDAVFESCAAEGVTLPPLLANAPVWLRQDRAYQQAALALYNGQTQAAADAFAAIARDPASPWRASAPYLRLRALVKGALADPTPQSFAAARAAIAELARAPAGTYGQGRVRDLNRILDYRDRPAELLRALDRALNAPDAPADAAVAFRDYLGLSDKAAPPPDMIDWMATLKAVPVDRHETAAMGGAKPAFVHAQARWRASKDSAWLLAALSLAAPGDPAAGPLLQDAAGISADQPVWLSLQLQSLRLQLASGEPRALRARLDAILKRDLSLSDRNVFLAARTQLAEGPQAFVRLALRRRLCGGDGDKNGCVRERWDGDDDFQPTGVYDGERGKGDVGLGEDARAVIDRLPLAARMGIGADRSLPAGLRLDIDLTSYARAVALQDNAAIDALARRLGPLLPQLADDWRRIPETAPGPAKRFAEFQILAKIPGLRFDLVDYTRPEGRTAASFQYYWMDWVLAPAGKIATAAPPALARYQQAGDQSEIEAGDPTTDLTCLGECQAGPSPLRLPDFAARQQGEAKRQRGYFVVTRDTVGRAAAYPSAGVTSVWDEMLAYVEAHPQDPRAPETLYWLVHVGHFGGSHDHSGRRAFRLLHARYPANPWTRRTPFYFD